MIKQYAKNMITPVFEFKLKCFLGTFNEKSNYVLPSGRTFSDAFFRSLTVAPSVGLFSKSATKPTKPSKPFRKQINT
jgi:hypothetical protein